MTAAECTQKLWIYVEISFLVDNYMIDCKNIHHFSEFQMNAFFIQHKNTIDLSLTASHTSTHSVILSILNRQKSAGETDYSESKQWCC